MITYTYLSAGNDMSSHISLPIFSNIRLRRIVDMEETEIMDTIYSFVKGAAIDNETYIDRLTGHKRLRTE